MVIPQREAYFNKKYDKNPCRVKRFNTPHSKTNSMNTQQKSSKFENSRRTAPQRIVNKKINNFVRLPQTLFPSTTTPLLNRVKFIYGNLNVILYSNEFIIKKKVFKRRSDFYITNAKRRFSNPNFKKFLLNLKTTKKLRPAKWKYVIKQYRKLYVKTAGRFNKKLIKSGCRLSNNINKLLVSTTRPIYRNLNASTILRSIKIEVRRLKAPKLPFIKKSQLFRSNYNSLIYSIPRRRFYKHASPKSNKVTSKNLKSLYSRKFFEYTSSVWSDKLKPPKKLRERRRSYWNDNKLEIPKKSLIFVRARKIKKNKRKTRRIFPNISKGNFDLSKGASAHIRIHPRMKSRLLFYRNNKLLSSAVYRLIANRLANVNRIRFIKRTFHFIKMKSHYNKYYWGVQEKIFNSWFRVPLTKSLMKISKNNTRFGIQLLERFYRRYGVLKVFSTLIKFSRLINKMRRWGATFVDKNKKTKKVTRNYGELAKHQKLMYFAHLTNTLNKNGKSAKSRSFMFRTLVLLKFSYKSEFMNSYIRSLRKVRPILSYKLVFTGGKKYRIPILMQTDKSYRIAGSWFAKNCSDGKTDPSVIIYNNIKSTLSGTGPIIKQKDDYHSASFENKSYIYLLKHLKKGFA